MRKTLKEQAIESYQFYEQKAENYFQLLLNERNNTTYLTHLKQDFTIWKKNHRKGLSALFLQNNQQKMIDQQMYQSYFQSLKKTNKLQPYLERSIAYLYMRDLGKALNEKTTQAKIKNAVEQLERNYLSRTPNKEKQNASFFTTARIYRWGQKEGIELTIIWLLNKLQTIELAFPKGIDPLEAKRKLIKLIAGVVIHQLDHFDKNITSEERAKKLDQSIRIGYAYGLTYPFIDDLLDANVLTKEEKQTYSHFIRETLLTGEVPPLKNWPAANQAYIEFIHDELSTAFLYIKKQQSEETRVDFLNTAYVFFEAQERDRIKDLDHSSYTNEELFIPVILKSSFSRMISRKMLPASHDSDFDERTFYYGIYNQLADDFTDMFSDMEARRVTPYTYYLTYHEKRSDLVNPFELYWTVVSHLIHTVYESDPQTREVILSRAINSQKRFKEKLSKEKYQDIIGKLSFDHHEFDRKLQVIIKQADDVAFLDKLVRDHITAHYRTENNEQKIFFAKTKKIRKQINELLPIPDDIPLSTIEEQIIAAANHSLKSGGKRLRPIMTWFLSVEEFQLDAQAIAPLLRSIEYMHTASLIFDDLPAQDDAPLRRGQPTLHTLYDTATAELTALYLTQKAVTEQASLTSFSASAVQKLLKYSSEIVAETTRGQAMDLRAKNKSLTIEQLNAICFYKTGIAFEASLVMPAILAERPTTEIEFLKKFAYHAGIAFQIKDDILDTEGDTASLGKLAHIDTQNKTMNYVTVLGIDEAKKAMWEHYCQATEELEKQQLRSNFLKYFLDYLIQRNN